MLPCSHLLRPRKLHVRSSRTCQILSSLVILLLVLDASWRSALAADTPFTGAPAVIPGPIQAADFDNGGEGIAYDDTTPGNAGGAYRSTDVDIQASSEGGYNIGWIASTEWLNYTVNVAAAGSYRVQLRVASLQRRTGAPASLPVSLNTL